MLSGILRVLARTRPALAERSPERAILDRQTERFERELAAAERRRRLLSLPSLARAYALVTGTAEAR